MNHLQSFLLNHNLIEKLGEGAAHLIWAMGLYLEEPDLDLLASESLTDSHDDKKIDFIRVDRDSRRIVFAQGYYSTKKKDTAPANKASDLNTAAAWLLSGKIDEIPTSLRPAIIESRSAIDDGDIDSIELLYVHNLSESVNVAKELQTVAAHLRKSLGDTNLINVSARELGLEALERLFETQESAIEVRDAIVCPAKIEFLEEGPNWRAGILSIPGPWFNALFKQYSDQLFSANYRGFLGISKRRKINSSIRQSAENKPQDFWVFNNGVTLLTLKMEPNNGETKLTGISIINGAQTTGSIGSIDLEKYDLKNLRVLGRIIECSDQETISDIVKFNNTQNEITTWDMYSNSAEQQRIEKEFNDLGHSYARKRRFRKQGQIVGIEDVAQPLLAFQGDFMNANRGKNGIFERKALYKTTFEGKSARHVLFVFTLAKAVDERRLELKSKSNTGKIMSLEENQLDKLRHLKFKYFFISVVAKCLEPILGQKIDVTTVAFNPVAAKNDKNSIVELTAAWSPIVESVLTYVCTQIGDDVSQELAVESVVDKVSKTVSAMLYASRSTLPFEAFLGLVSPS